VTAVVRLVFGSPLGLPSADDVQLLLGELGVQSGNVRAAARQVWGVAKYEATDRADSSGQRIGIAVYGRDAADAKLLTKAGAAQAKSIDVPKLAEPRRVSWPTLIMIIGTLIGGWALIGVLIDVSQSFDTVIGADWLWVIMAFVLAQLAYVASAVEGIGSVPGPLPFGRAVAVEVAKAFSALAGGTAAVFAGEWWKRA
jgi:hypothetical protein